jgi:YfiH family protein
LSLPAPFHPVAEHIGAELPGARVLFTTRRGGVSAGPYESLNLGLWTDDEPGAVGENRERVARLTGIARERFAQGRQVHEADVARVTAPPEPGYEPQPADGQATPLAGVAPVVLTADCLPVAVAGHGVVAMLHAGWRGLAGGVLEAGVTAVRELGAEGPLEAAIGPGAGPCCYEVGDEVRTAFAGMDPPGAFMRGRNLDLKRIARAQLAAAGVERVHDVGLCTICSDPGLFFSHRRDAGVTGRQAGVAWRA